MCTIVIQGSEDLVRGHLHCQQCCHVQNWVAKRLLLTLDLTWPDHYEDLLGSCLLIDRYLGMIR